MLQTCTEATYAKNYHTYSFCAEKGWFGHKILCQSKRCKKKRKNCLVKITKLTQSSSLKITSLVLTYSISCYRILLLLSNKNMAFWGWTTVSLIPSPFQDHSVALSILPPSSRAILILLVLYISDHVLKILIFINKVGTGPMTKLSNRHPCQERAVSNTYPTWKLLMYLKSTSNFLYKKVKVTGQTTQFQTSFLDLTVCHFAARVITHIKFSFYKHMLHHIQAYA